MKKGTICIALFCLLAPVASLRAADGGDALFRNKCGACHVKGGEAAPVNPGEKAASVWEKYFKRGRHPVGLNVSEAELELVLRYLMERAADSDKPEMLAIPK